MALDPDVSNAGDNGYPYIKTHPTSYNGQQLSQFIDAVIREVSTIKFGGLKLPQVGFHQQQGILFDVADKQYTINPKQLRLECRSALSRDEFTDELLIDPATVPDDIYPLSMNPVGNYALGVNWSDGHASLYPYDQLLDLVQHND